MKSRANKKACTLLACQVAFKKEAPSEPKMRNHLVYKKDAPAGAIFLPPPRLQRSRVFIDAEKEKIRAPAEPPQSHYLKCDFLVSV